MFWNIENEVVDNYRAWLQDEAIDVNKGIAHILGDDSIKSYCSYVKNAFAKVIKLRNNEADILKVANSYVSCNDSNRGMLKGYLKKVLADEKKNSSALVSSKTISNYISGLNMLFGFLDNKLVSILFF